jgi:spermidine synthase
MDTFKTLIAPIIIAIGFIVSGASALVYQVSWQRILALQSGVGIYSVAMIVGAFMAGLGIGSYLGGLGSRGMSPRRALHTFALIEIGIGGFALASSWIFYDLLYTQYGWLFSNPWRAGLIQFLSLLIPTTLMGMSLPFLAQGVARHVSSAARTLGFYYGLNAIGAALGAFVTTWFLIRFLGISGAISLGAAGNLCVGAAIFVLARFLPLNADALASDKASNTSKPIPSVDTNLPFGGWVAMYTVSGFAHCR